MNKTPRTSSLWLWKQLMEPIQVTTKVLRTSMPQQILYPNEAKGMDIIMIKIAVCDDEYVITNQIEELIDSIANRERISVDIDVFYSGADLEKSILILGSVSCLKRVSII